MMNKVVAQFISTAFESLIVSLLKSKVGEAIAPLGLSEVEDTHSLLDDFEVPLGEVRGLVEVQDA